jgi:hydroxyacylglutathione hydrolase
VLITGFATGSTQANCYLIAPRAGAAAVVVDPGDEAVHTLEYYFGVNDLTPAAVLLTHGHPAHTATVADLGLGWDIPVFVHPADRRLLAESSDGEPEQVVEMADGDDLQLAGIAVAVHHTPGHTAGSVTLQVHADTDEGPVPVLLAGDTLTKRSCGTSVDPVRAAESVREKLLVFDDRTVVLPGHGPSTTIGALRRLYLPED